MAKEWLEEILKNVTRKDVEKVDLNDAYANFVRISLSTPNPKRPGRTGSKTPSILSQSRKFEKGRASEDPLISRFLARGVYLMPAGKHGTCDACKDKTAGCAAACLHDSGHQDLANQIARTDLATRYPSQFVGLLHNEIKSFVAEAENNPIRKGGPLLASLRIDGTSELHLDDEEVGDILYGGMHGEFQEVHKSGPYKGRFRLIGSEYGKRLAKNPLGIIGVPKSRQPNVTRVASWNEGLHVDRAREIIRGGNDITGPNINATKARKTEGEQRVAEVPFKGGSLFLPIVNYDEHDITGAREQTGAYGELSDKKPGFAKRTEENAKRSKSFLISIPTFSAEAHAQAVAEGRAEPLYARPTPVSIRPSRGKAFRGE
jgi:hypothetical protein